MKTGTDLVRTMITLAVLALVVLAIIVFLFYSFPRVMWGAFIVMILIFGIPLLTSLRPK